MTFMRKKSLSLEATNGRQVEKFYSSIPPLF